MRLCLRDIHHIVFVVDGVLQEAASRLREEDVSNNKDNHNTVDL